MPQNSGSKGPSEAYKRARQVGILTALPIVFVLGPLIGFFLGDWIDRKFEIAPAGLIVFILMGFGASVRESVRMIKEALRD